MKFDKKMNRSGGVTLPSALRREYGLAAGEKFQVSVNQHGDVVLKRTEGQCLFCQADQDLIPYLGRLVCRSCVSSMAVQAGEDHE
nr:AbrB/MazE/SpoVT family DNA-binding domain-containing protein [Paenibacillus sanguinis]